MKRIIIPILLVLCTATVFSIDVIPYAGAEYGASVFQQWVIPNAGAEFTFKPWLGAGVELQGLIGTTYGDTYAAGFIYGRLWVLTLGVGVSTQITGGELPANSEYYTFATSSDPVNLALTTGLDIPLFTSGAVSWALTSSLDFIFTDFPVKLIEDEDGDVFQNIITNLFSVLMQAAFGGSIGSLKGGIGVRASFPGFGP